MMTTKGWARASEFWGDLFLGEMVARPVYVPGYKFSAAKGMAIVQEIYFNKTRRSSRGMNFCNTKKGYLGWTPPHARTGDRVCLFADGRAPFLIRDKTDGTYELVGDAYIHGIMYGEGLNHEGCDWQDIRFELIALRA
jgi:hypothetical protein